MSATLNDIITDGTAKFKVIKFASSNDMDAVQSEIDTKLEKNTQVNNALKVNNHTVASNVPSNAVFTDTTYSVFSGSSPGVAPAPTVEDAYLRSDGTWQIVTKQVTVEPPVQNGNLTYDGTEQTPVWSNYDSLALTLTGVTTATDAGTYNAVFTPNFGYIWSDGEVGAKTITWTIDKTTISAIPSQSGTLTYSNGNTLSPTWSDYSTSQLEISGETDGTDAGTYTAIFTPKNNYKWSDGSTTSKNVTWTIEKVALTEAQSTFAQSGTLTYSGSAQSPVISGFDSNYHDIRDNSQTDAGTYTATVSLKNNYKWYDRTTTDKSVSWSIGKASCGLQLSTGSMSLDTSNLTKTVTVTRLGSGTIAVESGNTSVATVSISGTTLTISAIGNGTATITVNVAENSNYLSGSASLSVSVSLVSTTLNSNSWSTISQIAQAGTASNYWSVGDCKEITLNGKIGDILTLSNTKLCVFILDFNHLMNGTAENNIIFGGFKTTLMNGIDVALCDSNVISFNNRTDGTLMLNINHSSNSNYGGWKGCDFRYDILGATSRPPSEYNVKKTSSCIGYDATADTLTNPKADTLLAALPSDLRSNMRLWKRWVDAVGGTTEADANIQVTHDAITLLAEPEIFPTKKSANQYEYNYNAQMMYYANSNSRIKKSHSDTSTAVNWWESSVKIGQAGYGNTDFCNIAYGGQNNYFGVCYAAGLAPAFKI